MENFHRAKHWILFLAIYVLPMVLYMGFMMFFVTSAAQSGDPTAALGMMKYFMYILLIPVAIQYGWMYSVGVGLQDYIPSDLRMKTGFFKIVVLGILVYVMLMLFYSGNMMANIMDMNMEALQNGETVDPNTMMMSIMGPFLVLVPFGFLAIVGQIYAYYFVAKSYKVAEHQQTASFGDFVGEFFMIWFLFVGIWIMQPTINKITGENPESRIDDLGKNPFE